MLDVKKINPFPPKGVISLIGAPNQKLRTVPTPCFENAAEQSLNFVNFGNGQVVSVTGPHGSGKTHLLYYCIETVRQESNPSAKFVQLYAKTENPDFTSLYRQIVRQIDYTLLREVNVRFLGYIAKQEMDKTNVDALLALLPKDKRPAVSEQYKGHKQQVKDQVDMTPDIVYKYFEDLVLASETILGERSEQLKAIGGDDFKKAFYYIDKPAIGEETAYKWLQGEILAPDECLRIGVGQSLTTVEQAKNALVIIITLFRYAGIRLLLYIDQLEKLLTGTDDKTIKTNAGILHTLAEKFSVNSAFLMIVGSNEGMKVMPKDFWERVGITSIKMDQVELREANDLIKLYIQEGDNYEQYQNEGEIFPFKTEAVKNLVDLCGGNRRRLLQTCYLVYKQYIDDRRNIDTEAIKMAVQKTKEQFALPAVIELIRAVLNKKGLPWKQQVQLTRTFTADIVVGEEANPLVIIEITDPLYILEEVERALDITRSRQEVSKHYPHAKFIVIAMGYISSQVVVRLQQIVDDCIVFEGEEFSDKFEDLINALKAQPDTVVVTKPDDPLILQITENIKKEFEDSISSVKNNIAEFDTRLTNYTRVQKAERTQRVNSPRNIEWREWVKKDQEKFEGLQDKLKSDADTERRHLQSEGETLRKSQRKSKLVNHAIASGVCFLIIYWLVSFVIDDNYYNYPERIYSRVFSVYVIGTSVFVLALIWYHYFFIDLRKISPLGSETDKIANSSADIKQLALIAKTNRINRTQVMLCLKSANPLLRYFGVQNWILNKDTLTSMDRFYSWIDRATAEPWKPLYLAYLKAAMIEGRREDVIDHIALLMETNPDDKRIIYAISTLAQQRGESHQFLKLPASFITYDNAEVLAHACFESVLGSDNEYSMKNMHPLLRFAFESHNYGELYDLYNRYLQNNQFWNYGGQELETIPLNKNELESIIQALSPFQKYGLASYQDLPIGSYYLRMYRFFSEIEWLADRDHINLRS